MSQISVRVNPNASKDEIVGLDESGRLKIRLCAAPVQGAANRQLIKLLAKRLGVGKSQVRILSGEKRREKLVEIKGITGAIAELLK